MRTLILISLIIVILSITVLSLLPPKNGFEIPTNDKVGHFIAYSVLSLNACLLFPTFNKKLLYFLLGILVYSILIEFVQGFIGRECSFYDFLANLCGVVIGFVLYLFPGRLLIDRFYKK